jgi:hypothetical protein
MVQEKYISPPLAETVLWLKRAKENLYSRQFCFSQEQIFDSLLSELKETVL